MILQVIEKNPVKIVTNEKNEEKILTRPIKVSHETFNNILLNSKSGKSTMGLRSRSFVHRSRSPSASFPLLYEHPYILKSNNATRWRVGALIQCNPILMTLKTQETVHCEICNKTYGREHLLERHMTSLHEPLRDALFNRRHGHMTIKFLLPTRQSWHGVDTVLFSVVFDP